jgi:hypothetical protein
MDYSVTRWDRHNICQNVSAFSKIQQNGRETISREVTEFVIHTVQYFEIVDKYEINSNMLQLEKSRSFTSLILQFSH